MSPIQKPDITSEQLHEVLFAANAVTCYANGIINAVPAGNTAAPPWLSENLLDWRQYAQYWVDHICPKILKEIPQSVADFYEQFLLTGNNLTTIIRAIRQQAEEKPSEEQRFAICDTLYDTLVQTGMHQKTITDLLNLIEKYADNIAQDENIITALQGHAMQQQIQSMREAQLRHIRQLRDGLTALRHAWNTTKLKFSTIISDLDIVTDDYATHFNQLNLQAALNQWQLLANDVLDT